MNGFTIVGTRARRGAGFLVVFCFCLSSLSCFSERDGRDPIAADGDCSIPASAIGANKVVVAIRDFNFYPDTVRVRPGTEITWVNCETTVRDYHTSTSATGLWTSNALNRGDFYTRRFDANGSYDYFCEPHPFMRGRVIVQ